MLSSHHRSNKKKIMLHQAAMLLFFFVEPCQRQPTLPQVAPENRGICFAVSFQSVNSIACGSMVDEFILLIEAKLPQPLQSV
jgi:hypothetical protein